MRQLLRFMGLLLASAALLRPGETRAQSKAFSCDGTFYQIKQPSGSSTSYLYRVDRTKNPYTVQPANVTPNTPANNLGVLVNGLAYNSQNSFMYALTTKGLGGSNADTNIKLYKIGQDSIKQVGKSAITVGNTTTPLNLVVASGAFDKAGNYYFSSQNTNTGTAPADYSIYVLRPGSSTPTVATKLATTNSGNYTLYDLAYNPADNTIYGFSTPGTLYKVAIGFTNGLPSSATVTSIAAATLADRTPVGTAFFDIAGNMFGSSNGTVGTAANNYTDAVDGNFYQISPSDGTFTLISSIAPASVSDGASCINPGNTIDVTKTLTNVKTINAFTFDLSYAVRVRNTYTSTDTYVQVTDLLKGNANPTNANTTKNVTFPTATSIKIISAPVVSSDNGATLVANTNYSGLSGNGGLLDGNQQLTAGQEAVITYTIEVAFANASSVPTTVQNNTAYATSSSSGSNAGYTLSSNDVLLSPNNLIAYDASTNSGNYPALRPADANNNAIVQDSPAPTPVTFAPSINGTVFEDINYGGGLGRSLGTSQGAGRAGARVELFTGSTVAGVTTYTFDSAQLTATDGSYSFTALANGTKLAAGGNYVVRVVNSTVTSSRAGYTNGLLPVQTYRTSVDATNGTVPDPNRVGGEYPGRTDAGNGGGTTGTTLATLTPATGTTAAESISYVTLPTSSAPAVAVDFGYNFDTVVNTNDAGQGSLRQFITNANALSNATLAQAAASTGGPTPAAGVETSIFMVPGGAAVPGLTAYSLTTNPGLQSQLTNGVAVITPATLLPVLGNANNTNAANTSLDGTTQTQNVGDTNSLILRGNVAVGAGASATTLGPVNGPEVQLTGNANLALGLDVASTATGTTLKGLAIYGFGNLVNDDNNALIRSNAGGLTITQSVLGAAATSFSVPSTATNANALNIINNNGGSVTITNNLIGFANGKGIALNPGVAGAVVTGNEVRGNDQGNGYLPGLDIQGSAAQVSGNLFAGNAGEGISSNNSPGSNLISGNTVTGNGVGTSSTGPVATSGIYVFGPGNTVSQNVVASNYGAGIMLNNGASTTTLSQNSIYGNGTVVSANNTAASGDIGIDLQTSAPVVQATQMGTAPYVTLNNSATAGANGLLNYPVLVSATVSNTTLVLRGYAKPNALIELFTAQANPSALNATGANFGQGRNYLTSFTAGSAGGSSYSGLINGFNQGSDTNANAFTVSLPLSSLTPAQVAALQSGTALLTSTATLNSATSEFSGNLAVAVADVTVSLNGGTTLYAGQPTSAYTVVFTNEGPSTATNVARVVTLPTGATLTTAQRLALTNQGASISTDGLTLTFAPLATLGNNATSTVTVAFTAPLATSTTLALTATTTADSQGPNAAPDQASLPLTTLATADATAAVTLTSTATTGTITATFGNNGPQTALGLTPTVQLPANLAGLVVPSGWTYAPATGLLTYNTANSALATGSTLAVTLTYPLSSAPAAPVTAVASITTTSDEAGRTANNVAQAALTNQFDLITSLSGPTSALIGAPVTLLVTTTNNGPNLAPNATQTVSIPSAASLAGSIFITNGGTYSYSGGVGTVTFPALANVPAGQTVTNSISFLAPSAGFAPSATVSSTALELSTANNTAYLNGAASGAASGTASGATLGVSSGASLATENEATSISANVTMVAPGTVVTYTVTSTNRGGAGASASATVGQKVQLLPGLTASTLQVGGLTGTTGGTTLQFATTGGTTSYDPATGVLTYYSVTQVPGASTTYPAIALTAPATTGNDGQLTATAIVSTNLNDNVPADNMASVGVLVQTTSDVTTTLTGPSSTLAGLPASYVVRFVNNGATNASGVTETVQLPANLTGGVSILDASGAAISGASYNAATGLVTLPTQATLGAGAQQQYTLVLTVPAQTFPVSSAVASTSPDGVATNNAAALSTAVTPNGDLAVSISGPSVAVVGNMVTYTIGTTNNGPTTATNAVVTLQLPAGLTLISSGSNSNSGPNGPATKTTSNGIDTYTFPAFSSLAAGVSVFNYLNFQMPSPSGGLLNGLASVSSTTPDAVVSNNMAGITTSIAPATTAQAELRTSVTLRTTVTGGTVAPGTLLTFETAFRNAGDGSGTAGNPAPNVMPSATLPAGLSVNTLKVGTSAGQALGTQSGNIITFNNTYVSGATYNVTTGQLIYPTIASAPVRTGANPDYYVNFPAPAGATSVLVSSAIAGSISDNFAVTNPSSYQSNTSNFSAAIVAVSAAYDVTTTLVGPATAQPGTTASYTVTTLNNGPSPASASTTQNVTGLPTDLTAAQLTVDGQTGTGTTTLTFPSGATYSAGTLTLPAVAALPAGAANAVAHSFAFAMPASGSVALTATVASANESSTATLPNTATLTTTQANIAPVAQNVWNALQSPRGNTANLAAANGLPISPLSATDANGANTIASYTLVTVPDATTQGKLYVNGSGAALGTGQPLTLAQAATLTFAPVPGYVGDVTFTYTTTDNGNGTVANALTSPVVTYTIMVAQDQSTTYATFNSSKGGTTPYSTGDVLAQTSDPNTAGYTSTGTLFDATTGVLLAGAANGLGTTGTNALLVGGTLPAGVSLDPATGRIYVSDRTQLVNNTAARSYTVMVQTTDLNGGTNTVPVTFTLGAYPLPVELVKFDAQAVQNRDAQLSWITALELHNDHFEVERSLDGTTFAKVGQVAGQGSKATATTYAFLDAGIGPKVAGQPVYYRLKQVDTDGTSSYSPVRSVRFGSAAVLGLALYPNPASSATSLDLSALPTTGTYQVLLLDATGRQVRQLSLGGGLVQTLTLSDLATGTYQVLVSGQRADGSVLRQVLRLTKE